ncbi:MAG: protein kinase, partial [Planctomycetota bacterium]
MNRTDTETRRASRSDEVTFLSPRLIDAGSVPRADVERLVAAWRKSGNASFIDYLIEVRFLNAFGARVIRAAQEGSSDVSLDDILRKLKSVGKLQMPATLAPAAAPAAPVMAPAAAFIEREAPRVGTKMGRFMLDEALGEGATSITYRAFHPALGVPVAVKVFKRGSNMPGVVDQFVREARLLARIDHPAIVRVIDVDHDGGTPYIVFEYVGAMTLEEAVGAFGGLDARRVARIGARLAAGLGAAHKLGVLHRDIKPANILVRKDGQPRLADFGLALLGDHDREARGQIVGTPAYMAPEVVVQSGTIDHRADMYSLGATLWHAAVGHPPFPRGDVTQMLLAHVNDEPQEICEVDPYFDEELSDVIMRLLSKRPDERYRDWESVHDALSSTNVHQGKSSSRVWSIGGSSFLGASIAVGMVVGEQYRTEAFIDSDSSSMTYRSTDLNSNRPVFLRMLRTEVLNREEGVLSQVEQDVLKASRLRHPNVLHTEPVKQIGGLPVLVMECFDGSEPLSRRMRSASQPVSLPAAVSIIQQLAAALNAGHQEGLVHSGIQPQSVLVDAENRVKLSGFGLARLGGHYRTTSGGV